MQPKRLQMRLAFSRASRLLIIERVHCALFLLQTLMALTAGCSGPRSEGSPRKDAREHPLVEGQVPARLCGGVFLVEVFLNARGPFVMELDTGAGVSILYPHAADDLQAAAVSRSHRVYDAGGRGSEQTTWVRIESAQIGSVCISGFDALVIDDHPLFMGEPTRDPRIDGILGFDVFRGSLWTLDYPAGLVQVRPGSLRGIDGTLPLRVHPYLPYIEVEIQGVKVPMAIDSGGDGGFTLPIKREWDLVVAPQRVGTGHAIYGPVPIQAARLSGVIGLGDVRFHQPIVILVDRPRASIGIDVLRHFRITIDADGRLVLLERDTPGPPDLGPPPMGAYVLRAEDSWRIVEVFPDTPAANAGLMPGDVIVSIDGRAVSLDPCTSIGEILRRGPASLVIERSGELLLLAWRVDDWFP
jgi:hypothetical protein